MFLTEMSQMKCILSNAGTAKQSINRQKGKAVVVNQVRDERDDVYFYGLHAYKCTYCMHLMDAEVLLLIMSLRKRLERICQNQF